MAIAPSDVDVLVGDIPFWLAITGDTPYQRETAQYQRDQVDQQPEAGEQSLAGWWTRSQMSFHYGAGLEYLDTNARPQAEDRLRFSASWSMNPWRPGMLYPAPQITQTLPPSGEGLDRWFLFSGRDGQPVAVRGGTATSTSAGQVRNYNGSSWATRTLGFTAPIRSACSDGQSLYVATSTAIYQMTLAAGGAPTKLYDLSTTATPVLGYAKQRLLLALGPAVYVLDQPGPAIPTTPKYTHPLSGFLFSGFCDAPGAILAYGNSGQALSQVISFELTTVSDAPVLGAGTGLLTLPPGEQLNTAMLFLGSMLVLGTTSGLRVCPFDTFYKTVSLGPLATNDSSDGFGLFPVGVTSLTAFGNFIYCGTTLGFCMKVDLSAPLDDLGHYAWARDLEPDPGSAQFGRIVRGVMAYREDIVYLGLDGDGVYTGTFARAASDPPPWVELPKLRFGTVEDKQFCWLTIRADVDSADYMRVKARTSVNNNWTLAATVTGTGGRYRLNLPPAEWVQLRVETNNGTLYSYGVQALPAGKRQRMISLPVSVTDYQLTRSGVEVGYPGWAVERLASLEGMEEAGVEVSIRAPALFPATVTGVIERLSYNQVHDPQDRGSGTGGVLQIVLRTTG
jgi:hypothetical protein